MSGAPGARKSSSFARPSRVIPPPRSSDSRPERFVFQCPVDLLREIREPRSHGAPRLRAIQQCDERSAIQRFVGIPALGGPLGDRRTSTESWDAYEALDGRSLVTLLDRPQPWRVVRAWLADLAQEIDGALKDESLGRLSLGRLSLGRLSLDRVWITREGRAKLLDFRAPGALDISAKVSSVPVKSARPF